MPWYVDKIEIVYAVTSIVVCGNHLSDVLVNDFLAARNSFGNRVRPIFGCDNVRATGAVANFGRKPFFFFFGWDANVLPVTELRLGRFSGGQN